MNNISFEKLTGKEKLLAGINAARNKEEMSKGLKTFYYTAAQLSDNLIKEYISIIEADNKKPNVKGLLDYSKEINYIRFGRKVQLLPTPEQEKLLLKNVDAYRWAYNFLYADRLRYVKWLKEINLRTNSKNEELPKFDWKPEYKWISEKSGNQPQWFEGEVSSNVLNTLIQIFPKNPSGFRSKNKVLPTFCNKQGDTIGISNDSIHLSKIGWIKHTRPDYIPLDSKVCSIGISFKNGKWYAGISLQRKESKPVLKIRGKVLGLDVGITNLATGWNGNNHIVYNDRKLDQLVKLEKDRARWQRTASRRFKRSSKEQSKRYYFAQDQVRRLCERIANIRNDNLHQVSSRICRRDVKEIVIEDLNVKGMLVKSKKFGKKNRGRKFRKATAHASMGKLLDFVKYKNSWRGIRTTEVDRFFPSSKTCSACNQVNKDLGREEYWICPNPKCGVKHQRDKNASKVLYAQSYKDLPKEEVNSSMDKPSAGSSGSKGQVESNFQTEANISSIKSDEIVLVACQEDISTKEVLSGVGCCPTHYTNVSMREVKL